MRWGVGHRVCRVHVFTTTNQCMASEGKSEGQNVVPLTPTQPVRPANHTFVPEVQCAKVAMGVMLWDAQLCHHNSEPGATGAGHEGQPGCGSGARVNLNVAGFGSWEPGTQRKAHATRAL